MALEVSELSRSVFSGSSSSGPSGSNGSSRGGGGGNGPPSGGGSKQRKSNMLHHRWLAWLRSSRCSRNNGGVLGDKFGRLSESLPSSSEREEIDRLTISVSNDPWKPVFTTKVPINSGEEFLSLAMDSRKVYSGNDCSECPGSDSSLSFRPTLPLKTLVQSSDPRKRSFPISQSECENEVDEREEDKRLESSEEGSCCFSDEAETVQLVANSEGDEEEEALTSPSSSKSTPIRKVASNKSPFLERATNKFSSPFRRFRSGDHSSNSNSNMGHSTSSSTTSSNTSTDNMNKSSHRNMTELALFEDRKSLRFTREELLRLYVLKLDEEANYFKTNSPEDEFCNCPKCQSYYCEYYSQYLDEFEQRRNLIGPIEASVLMDDMLNNGMTFCSIM